MASGTMQAHSLLLTSAQPPIVNFADNPDCSQWEYPPTTHFPFPALKKKKKKKLYQRDMIYVILLSTILIKRKFCFATTIIF